MSAPALCPVRSFARILVLVAFVLGLIPWRAAEASPLPCASITSLAPGESWTDPGRISQRASEAASGACFTIDLPASGLLLLEVTVAAEAPRVWLSTPGREVGEGTATSRILVLPPGEHRFRVETEDPWQTLPPFRLDARFVATSGLDLRDELDSEIEVDPPPPAPAPVALRGELDSEIEVDPPPPTPNPNPALTGRPLLPSEVVAELCRQGEEDDHGDLFACATDLGSIGSTRSRVARGELGAPGEPQGGDADLFRFHQEALAPLEILAWGGADLIVELYDARGQRLDVIRGGEDGLRRVRALGPGTWFLRLTGREGAEGGYTLSLAPLER